jgi:hypothetical protein
VQIIPTPGIAWSNAAAAQQAAQDPRAGTVKPGSIEAAKPAIGDVERSSETLDRDANGQYTSGQSGRKPDADDSGTSDGEQGKTGGSYLDLPAIGQSSELDLMG